MFFQAKIEHSEILLKLIKELAEYEGMLDQVVGTVEQIEKTLFCQNPKVEAMLLKESEDSEVIGFALYFYNYSTFLCKHGIYIEDIYVREEFRGRGYGKKFFQEVCKRAIEKDCGRVEWWCLDWNKPSIDFYLKLGAKPMSDWTVYRLTSDEIKKIASKQLSE